MKWNESGFRPLLCTYRLNWARRTSWGWWDDWNDTVLQTQDSKFEPWRSEAEHATSRSRRLPTILTFTRGWGRNIFVSLKPPRPGTEPRTLAWRATVLTTTLGPPPIPPDNTLLSRNSKKKSSWRTIIVLVQIFRLWLDGKQFSSFLEYIPRMISYHILYLGQCDSHERRRIDDFVTISSGLFVTSPFVRGIVTTVLGMYDVYLLYQNNWMTGEDYMNCARGRHTRPLIITTYSFLKHY